MLFAALILTLIVQATANSCETLCDGKCGKAFGTTKCGVKSMGSNGDCTCYDGTTNKKPEEKKEACVCVTEWEDPGCTGKQKGCPAEACDDNTEPRWCIIANEGCATEKSDGGWAECDDNTPVFGQECVNKEDELKEAMYDEEATCESAYFDFGSDICENENFLAVCCATCADPPKPLETCDCGIDAVKGEENFQSGSVDGDKMCQWGTNCATFSEGCDSKGAKICKLKIEYKREKKCTDCNCSSWDGKNYSRCRLVTPARPCTGYCVKCESDGKTPMPGLYTTHNAECAKYEGDALENEEEVGSWGGNNFEEVGSSMETEEEDGSSTGMETYWGPEPEPTQNPLCSVGNGCCNVLGDEHCNMFDGFCDGEDNQNVRDGCALMCGQCVPEKKCTACNCNHWDGKNYSDCRLVTDDRPCNRYCVKCQNDGKTPMPGLYTTHSAECSKYENGLAFAEAHVTVADLTAQDFAVYGFAAIGLGFLLYGAGKHFITTKAYVTVPATLEEDV